jgi:hypothetical protein
MAELDITRMRVEIEQIRVSTNGLPPPTYDPRLEVIAHYALGSRSDLAWSTAEAITRDNPAAGYVAWESLKRYWLGEGLTMLAGPAANEAVSVLKKLNGG